MEIHSAGDFYQALVNTRTEFDKITFPVRAQLNEALGLFVDVLALIGEVAKDTDDEKYALEACVAVLRRVVASWVLLESGLAQEAHMILRNSMELVLIAVDICYSKASLDEWKKTETENVNQLDGFVSWYFTAKKMHDRITNACAAYPQLEVALAKNVYREWKRISNMSLHAHSQAQIRSLFDSAGHFQMLGLKSRAAYERDFRLYEEIIFDVLTVMVGIPKYRDLIGKGPTLLSRANVIAGRYSSLRDALRQGSYSDQFISETNRTETNGNSAT